MKEEICNLLLAIEKENNIKILFAVESGSRAWGFSSPDSDYDVRFIFARPTADHIKLTPLPDNIEVGKGDFDIIGWSSGKALTLMLKGNHAIREWLRSPIVYINHRDFISMFLSLADETPSITRLKYSYQSLLHNVIRDYLSPDKTEINLKKYFYAIRCAAVLKWLDINQSANSVPPMQLSELVSQTLTDQSLVKEITDLMRLKQETSELGLGPRKELIDMFIFSYNWKRQFPSQPEFTPQLIEKYDSLLRLSVKAADLASG